MRNIVGRFATFLFMPFLICMATAWSQSEALRMQDNALENRLAFTIDL